MWLGTDRTRLSVTTRDGTRRDLVLPAGSGPEAVFQVAVDRRRRLAG